MSRENQIGRYWRNLERFQPSLTTVLGIACMVVILSRCAPSESAASPVSRVSSALGENGGWWYRPSAEIDARASAAGDTGDTDSATDGQVDAAGDTTGDAGEAGGPDNETGGTGAATGNTGVVRGTGKTTKEAGDAIGKRGDSGVIIAVKVGDGECGCRIIGESSSAGKHPRQWLAGLLLLTLAFGRRRLY